jgi:Protein of unknown function (DUF3467)
MTRITRAVCLRSLSQAGPRVGGRPNYTPAGRTSEETGVEPEPQERHFNIQIEPQALAGVYANFANVSHSDYEFTITFARVDHDVEGPDVPGIAVVRVNLAPLFMRQLIDALQDNYSKWSTRQGIKLLPEYDGEDDPDAA